MKIQKMALENQMFLHLPSPEPKPSVNDDCLLHSESLENSIKKKEWIQCNFYPNRPIQTTQTLKVLNFMS